jgi:hypothetical protein
MNVPPSIEESSAKPLGIEDDTMAWLEGLAAKQGAKPEELLTKPEERSEELPNWLSEAAEEKPSFTSGPSGAESKPVEASIPPVPEKSDQEVGKTPPLPDLRSILMASEGSQPEQLLPPSTDESGAVKPLDIEDHTMAWLEGLAAKQGAKPEELLSKPEERTEEIPDWLKGTTREQAPSSEEEPSIPKVSQIESKEPTGWEQAGNEEPRYEQAPEVISPMNAEERAPVIPASEGTVESILSQETLPTPTTTLPETAPQGQASMREEEDITAWLKNLDESSVSEKIPPEADGKEPQAPTQEGIPEWLSDLEGGPSQSKPTPYEEVPEPKGDLPEWLLESSVPSVAHPIPQPEEGGIKIPESRAEEPVPAEQPTPTIPTEWTPVEKQATVPEPTEEIPAAEKAGGIPTTLPVVPVVPREAGILAPVPSQDKDSATLADAQKSLESNHLVEAVKEYSKLIRKGRLLDEVIHDLREALYRFPVDIIVWQTLGDAYMRGGRLQDALDAYTKAEELLR